MTDIKPTKLEAGKFEEAMDALARREALVSGRYLPPYTIERHRATWNAALSAAEAGMPSATTPQDWDYDGNTGDPKADNMIWNNCRSEALEAIAKLRATP